MSTTTITLSDLIVRHPDKHNGRPILAGTATTVRTIAIMYKQGLSPEEIIGELPLNLAQVYAALSYYHLHTDEIEADIRADAEAVLMSRDTPPTRHDHPHSPLPR